MGERSNVASRRLAALALVVALSGGAIVVVSPATPAVAATTTAAPHDPDTVERTTQDVLDGRDFREQRPTHIQRLRADIRQWFAERLAAILAGTRGSVIGWAIAALALVIALLLAFRLLRSVGRDPSATTVSEVRPTARPPEEWWSDVDRALGRDDLEGAVRAGYHAVVAQLALDGIVEDSPGRTLGEQRRDVAANAPALRDRFTAVTDRVEAVLYGGVRPSRADVDALRAFVPTGATR